MPQRSVQRVCSQRPLETVWAATLSLASGARRRHNLRSLVDAGDAYARLDTLLRFGKGFWLQQAGL